MKRIIHSLLVIVFFTTSISAQHKMKPQVYKKVERNQPAIIPLQPKVKSASTSRNIEVDYNFKKGMAFKLESSDLEVLSRDEQGYAQWFTGDLVTIKSVDQQTNITAWMDAAAKMQGLNPATNEYSLKQEWSDDDGTFHRKYDQRHLGVKVFDGEIILHGIGNAVNMQNGKVVPSALLPTQKSAAISKEDAQQVIIANTPGYKLDWNPLAKMGIGKDAQQWEGELVYYNHEGNYRLAYNYVLFANMEERTEYIVDAVDGKILTQWSKICKLHDHGSHEHCSHKKESVLPPPNGPTTATARDLLSINRSINTYLHSGTYFMMDGSRDMFRGDLSDLPDEPIGAIWTIDIGGQSPVGGNASFSQIFSNNNSWGNSPEGVSAHYNAGQAYDYFRNVHGRNSITGDGQTIVSIVNVTDEDGSSLGNAFYNSLAIWYGNGDNTFFPLGRALDVAGHELSHGVVENSANLVYQNEPGAMNESFADIFGAMIDRDDWLVGEDVVRPGVFPGGALRSISDPHNGAQTGDFGNGWQPRHTNERFTGSEDNGGVHLNSGIPNYAFYLFATQVGKETAERVYYRALTTYLTRSSGFKELRLAVERSAQDLYNQNVVTAASQAFADVGIGEGAPTDFETDFEANEGSDLLLTSTNDQEQLFIFDLVTGDNVFTGPLSTTPHQSKPSITDDGSRIVFVDNTNNVRVIDIDWTSGQFEERVVSNQAVWRNAVISKDGNKLALLETVTGDGNDNNIVVIDLPSNSEDVFELFNPSYTQGVQTGDVEYADAMEFDLTSNILMYDAFNVVESTLGTNNIEYWDIGFLQVWNPQTNGWPVTTQIDKLFGSLPENISIGNPTWSKNSPYIIAFDVIEENSFGSIENTILGMNIETYDQNSVTNNRILAYPNYSRLDDALVFDYVDGNEEGLGIIQLNTDKITASSAQASLGGGLRWGTWFTTGSRVLSDIEDIVEDKSALVISPVPANSELLISVSEEVFISAVNIEISNMVGEKLMRKVINATDMSNYKLDISDLSSGTYILSVRNADKILSKKFIKL